MLRLQITGRSRILKKSKARRGVTLTEIIVALGLFALLAIPAYLIFSYGAADEMSYHKTAAANRILESCRDEIKNLSYAYADKLGTSFSNINAPPSTFDTFMGYQKDFKDENFKLIGTATKFTQEPEHIKFDLKVTWTKKGGAIAEETLTFIKVK
jgi:prepilin-type N-terminal cleavage/methylation domain-containing protein